jgi:MFS family permease
MKSHRILHPSSLIFHPYPFPTGTHQMVDNKPTTPAANTAVIGALFFMFVILGLPSGLLGVAWPSIRNEFALTNEAIGAILAMGTLGHIISSFVSGRVVHRWGIYPVLVASTILSLFVMGGILLSPTWIILVMVYGLWGVASGLMDTSANVFVARYYTARVMNWMHASFGLGATLGPFSDWRSHHSWLVVAGGVWQFSPVGFACCWPFFSDCAPSGRVVPKPPALPMRMARRSQTRPWLSGTPSVYPSSGSAWRYSSSTAGSKSPPGNGASPSSPNPVGQRRKRRGSGWRRTGQSLPSAVSSSASSLTA